MSKFKINYHVQMSCEIEVEADSEEEAINHVEGLSDESLILQADHVGHDGVFIDGIERLEA